MKFIGYEQQEEGITSYFQVDNIASIKKIQVFNNLLYEFNVQQMGIIHAIVNGNRKSSKLNNPEVKALFEWWGANDEYINEDWDYGLYKLTIMAAYKLDTKAFKKHTKDKTAHQLEYWLAKTIGERLQAAFYINSVAYNFDINNPPRMDKTFFTTRKKNW